MVSYSKKVSFCPFRPDDLDKSWKVTFGEWEVVRGKLRHIRPDFNGDADKLFSGAPGMAAIKRVGSVAYRFGGGGVEYLRCKFECRLGMSDSFSVSLDEWAADWRNEFGMRGILSHGYTGSRCHEYDDQVLSPSEPQEVNCFEVVGEPGQVIFLLNGRELFRAKRSHERPHRQIEIRTRSGAEISDLTIETEGERPPCKYVKRAKRPKIAACIDFGDDVLYAPFTAEMLELMVQRLEEVGVERIYWLNTIRARDEAVGPGADAVLNRNLDEWNTAAAELGLTGGYGPETIRNCYPFLPKICQAAHARGMEVYSIHKMFDLGFFPSRGMPSPCVLDHFMNNHPEAMLERWKENGIQTNRAEPVRTIRLYKDDEKEHGLNASNISVWVSDDNKSYRRIPPDELQIKSTVESKSFKVHWEGGHEKPCKVQVISIEGLDITQPYFAVATSNAGEFTFRNRIYRLSEVLDAQGRDVAVCRNLPGVPRTRAQQWDGRDSFVFEGFSGTSAPTGGWLNKDFIELYYAIDGVDVGIAFRRGTIDFVRGTPDPLNPVVHDFWSDWIQNSLDAGADGIEIRIVHHRNIIDWANYGFGKLTQEAFKKRYGMELRPERACRQKHMQLLGDYYTDFVRRASHMTRTAGKLFQHHVNLSMDSAPNERAMTNIHWDWRRWLDEGLLDAVTLKNISPGMAFCDEVVQASQAKGVEVWACPYLNLILGMSSSWSEQLTQLMGRITDMGLDGITLYQSTSFLEPKPGDVVLKYPELKNVLCGGGSQ